MVLESLLSVSKAEKKPWETFFLGILYASFGILLSLWIFKSESSMIMVLLTVIATLPLIYKTFNYEEKKDILVKDEKKLIKEHAKALKFLMYLFFGFIVAYSMWFVFLPSDITETLFRVQLTTINQINAKISGTAAFTEGILIQIFANNLKVLMFTILFAFFYGAGTIFILIWNATVIAAAIGNFARTKFAETFGSYFAIIPVAVARYMTHGFFEILAYFIGGLAGGIISVAIINHDIESESFRRIVKDSFALILLSIVILVMAALIEVFITPALF